LFLEVLNVRIQQLRPAQVSLAKLAGLLLLLVILLRILSSFANMEKAFWACFLVWGVLSLIESLSSRKAEKSAGR